jgi:hypothetical protein
MIYTVSLTRLDRYRLGRKYFDLSINPAQFAAIREGVQKALGFTVAKVTGERQAIGTDVASNPAAV